MFFAVAEKKNCSVKPTVRHFLGGKEQLICTFCTNKKARLEIDNNNEQSLYDDSNDFQNGLEL